VLTFSVGEGAVTSTPSSAPSTESF
jgi:hypothetical protein